MSAFEIGLQDAWHPVGLTTLLVFVWFLTRHPRTIAVYLLSGCAFLYASFQYRELLITGVLDKGLTFTGVLTGLRIFYLGLGILFFVYGIKLWRQWWQFRFKGIAIPQREAPTQSPKKFKRISKALSIIGFHYVLGMVLVLTSSIITQDYGVYILILDAASKGISGAAQDVTVGYFMGSSIFVITIWLLLGFKFVGKGAVVLEKIKPTCLIVSSASFMAVSLGLIVQFIK